MPYPVDGYLRIREDVHGAQLLPLCQLRGHRLGTCGGALRVVGFLEVINIPPFSIPSPRLPLVRLLSPRLVIHPSDLRVFRSAVGLPSSHHCPIFVCDRDVCFQCQGLFRGSYFLPTIGNVVASGSPFVRKLYHCKLLSVSPRPVKHDKLC